MEDKICPKAGGQAVIEGVMMKTEDKIATAVRKESGEIVYRVRGIKKNTQKLFNLPFIRGTFVLFETLILGIKELSFSAFEAGEEDEEELTDFKLGLTIFVAFAIGFGLFFLLPSFLSSFIKNSTYANLFEGVLRLLMFVAYIYIISLSKDIKRVFQYHGAEHKSIYTLENNEELVTDNAQKYTTLHPRCGTSFLLLVMLLSIIVFVFADTLLIQTNVLILKNLIKFGIRIICLPIIAGIAYEFQKFTSKHLDNLFIRIIAEPGLLLQKLTTKEPDLDQLEVALVALRASLGYNIENAREIKEV